MKKPDIHRVIALQQLLLRFGAIERRTRHPDNFDQYETDIEHSYTLAMVAWFLVQYFPKLKGPVVIQLALVHDLVELHAGDTFAFAPVDVLDGKAAREAVAIEKLAEEWPDFPEMHTTIREYEARQTEEAKFVYALDKFIPILLNYLNQGRTWQYEGITFEKFLAEKEAKIPVSPEIDHYYRELLEILRDHLEFFAHVPPVPSKQV